MDRRSRLRSCLPASGASGRIGSGTGALSGVTFIVSVEAIVLGSLLLFPGCRRDEPGYELVTLEGRIENIDRTSEYAGEITVVYYSEKRGREVAGNGVVTRETEIMINGALAKLADLREGDRVRGEVRVEKKGRERIQTAVKIYVDRPEPHSEGS